tara:strand:+ start:87 stop:689 length:603 start_codon:yes stop_codon:yes gene_type:complete
MFFNNSFILASTSKSREKILKQNKLSFSKAKPICDESKLKKKLIKNKTTIKNISLELARLKSLSVSVKKKNILVVGSDTTISLNNLLLSKAKNTKEAKEKLLKMSGKTHEIYSSASVYYNGKEVWKSTQKTTVKIRKLTKKELDLYLAKAGSNILKSVGCYQIEKLGPSVIEYIRGDFFNVMGFPLFPFLKFLKKSNIKK